MTKRAKQQAIENIKDDLQRSHKAFLAFHEELNPIMGKLVTQQLKAQQKASNWPIMPSKANSRLIATCFFCKATNTVEYHNYREYKDYGKQ